MTPKTIIVRKKSDGSSRPYYAAVVGFPANWHRATYKGALRDVQRIQENDPHTKFVVKDMVNS